MKKLFIIAIIMSLFACSDPTSSHKTLDNAGYTNIQITGWKPFNCGKDDTFSTGFVAKNPRGKVVKGVVCCGKDAPSVFNA